MSISDIEANNDLLDVVRSALGQPRTRHDGKALYSCPFHPDQGTASLDVYPDHFRCRVCGEEGGVADWVTKYARVRAIWAAWGLPPPGAATPSWSVKRQQPAICKPPSETWQARGTEFVISCHERLFDPSQPMAVTMRRYLNDQGLNEATLIDNLVGFNDLDRTDYSWRWGGVEGKTWDKLWLPEGITIPLYVSDTNTLWSVKIRQRQDRQPSYLHVTGSVRGLFGADIVAGHGHVFVTQRELDCLLLRQFVLGNAAVVASGAMTTHDLATWLPYLARAEGLYIVAGYDDDGERMWRFWQRHTGRARRAVPVMGRDLTESWKAGVDLARWADEVLAGVDLAECVDKVLAEP